MQDSLIASVKASEKADCTSASLLQIYLVHVASTFNASINVAFT
jgi:hypothetical protein